MTEAEGFQQQLEQRKQDEDAAWEAHLSYIANMYASPARGYGMGNVYEEHGPYKMGPDGKLYRETRLK